MKEKINILDSILSFPRKIKLYFYKKKRIEKFYWEVSLFEVDLFRYFVFTRYAHSFGDKADLAESLCDELLKKIDYSELHLPSINDFKYEVKGKFISKLVKSIYSYGDYYYGDKEDAKRVQNLIEQKFKEKIPFGIANLILIEYSELRTSLLIMFANKLGTSSFKKMFKAIMLNPSMKNVFTEWREKELV